MKSLRIVAAVCSIVLGTSPSSNIQAATNADVRVVNVLAHHIIRVLTDHLDFDHSEGLLILC